MKSFSEGFLRGFAGTFFLNRGNADPLAFMARTFVGVSG